jgi:hypothetical protein
VEFKCPTVQPKIWEKEKMALKTFNLDKDVYKEFSDHCKKNGMSMSKKVENFIREELEHINSGGKLKVKRFVRTVNDIVNEKEHSFRKYC